MLIKKMSNKGDTIIEVLVALAVLGLAFAISYATSNGALENAQNAQEHSLALEYLDGQFADLRYVSDQPAQTTIPAYEYSAASDPDRASAFCLQPSSTSINGVTKSSGFNVFTFNSTSSGYPTNLPSQCQIQGSGFDYNIAIVPSESENNVFNAIIWWPGLGSLGTQQEELSYRIYDD